MSKCYYDTEQLCDFSQTACNPVFEKQFEERTKAKLRIAEQKEEAMLNRPDTAFDKLLISTISLLSKVKDLRNRTR